MSDNIKHLPSQPDITVQKEKGGECYRYMLEDLEEILKLLPDYYRDFAQYNGMSYRALLKLYKPISEAKEIIMDMHKRYYSNLLEREGQTTSLTKIQKRKRGE